MAMIVPTLNDVNITHVYSCATSPEVYTKLKSIHSDSSKLNQLQTLTMFLNFTMKPEQSIIEAYIEMEKLQRDLNEVGCAIDEITAVTQLIKALPKKHEAFKKAWGSVPVKEQTIANLFARLKKEDIESKMDSSQTSGSETSSGRAFYSGNTQQTQRSQPRQRNHQGKDRLPTTPCPICNRMGHWKKDCRYRQGGPPPQQPQHFTYQSPRRGPPFRGQQPIPSNVRNSQNQPRYSRDSGPFNYRNQPQHHQNRMAYVSEHTPE